jgi:alpha-N-arabinofuranosidase
MANARKRMDGLSLHYYTVPSGIWDKWGPATGFGEIQWHSTLRAALKMDELITKHSAIMDKYDPEKKVGLVVDEWGTWTDVEPGTNPGFLYQQNTLRDAQVAALHFHVFQRHADRVVMANLAQAVNVLQAVILTDHEKMLRTPTYWVFEMFKVHQGETTLPVTLQTPDYTFEKDSVPMVSASASRAAAGGPVHVSLVNTNPHFPATVRCQLAGLKAGTVTGRVLTADAIDAHNTFDAPDAVSPKPFTSAKLAGGTLELTLPPKSIVVLELR